MGDDPRNHLEDPLTRKKVMKREFPYAIVPKYEIKRFNLPNGRNANPV
jgi:hypothetical protein